MTVVLEKKNRLKTVEKRNVQPGQSGVSGQCAHNHVEGGRGAR